MVKELRAFLESSTSAYLSALSVERYLKEEGFRSLLWDDDWHLQNGDKFFINMGNGCLLAFKVGAYFNENSKIIMAGCHTDFPCLRLKYNPQYGQEGYQLLNTEGYGGGIWNSFLNRPLSLSGKVMVSRDGIVEEEYVDLMEPILIIPALAIHFNREVNEKNPLHLQSDMQPIFSLDEDISFIQVLSEKLQVDEEAILAYDLYVYNAEESRLVGAHREMILSPRIDNQASVFGIMKAMTLTDNENTLSVGAFFNHEEVGSSTASGAASHFLKVALERIYDTLGYEANLILKQLPLGRFLSVDGAHAKHPAYPAKSDPYQYAMMNKGVAIKETGKQTYLSDIQGIGEMVDILKKACIPYQRLANQSDLRGGSTLGNIIAPILMCPGLDMGIAMLSMHSAGELAGVKDIEYLVKAIEGFYNYY